MKTKKTEYRFDMLTSDKEKNKMGIRLQDGTIVLVDKTGLRLGFPKKKFRAGIKRQDKNKSKFYQFNFSSVECKALIEGFNRIINKMSEGVSE